MSLYSMEGHSLHVVDVEHAKQLLGSVNSEKTKYVLYGEDIGRCALVEYDEMGEVCWSDREGIKPADARQWYEEAGEALIKTFDLEMVWHEAND